MTTVDPTTLVPFRQSYPLDFHLYNDDEQEVLYITDDPAGQNLHMHVSNASGQNINLLQPANTTASATNYHFALRFRPGTLSIPSQIYASFAAFALTMPQANLAQTFQQFVTSSSQRGTLPAPLQQAVATTTSTSAGKPSITIPGAIQAFAVDTASTIHGTLQGWNLSYQQDPDGTTVLYFLSTQARTLAPGDNVAITLPHLSASGAEGARGTRVELLYQQLTFSSDATPLSGHRQNYLSIVNQIGQKQIPLNVSFIGFNSILNDGKTPNTLTLRITNLLQDGPIALNPTGSSAPSKFILSFDIQDKDQEDWTLGTASEVGAIVIAATDTSNWSVTPPTSQQASPEWIVTPQKTKTLLAADEALLLTLSNIVTASPGQTNLYVRYENIPGYWDGQFVVTIEKAPLLYRGNNVGIGTTAPGRPLTIRGSGTNEELISFENAAGNTAWHLNQHIAGSGLNFAESGIADGRLFIQAGGNVGISTLTPAAKLTVSASAQHLQLRREVTEHAGDKILFLELYQDEHDSGDLAVPEVHPSIRFHHHRRFWHRIEGRNDGIHFKTGDLTLDTYIDIFANNGHFSGDVVIGTTNPTVPSLEVKGGDFQLAVTNAQNHQWGLVNWTDDKLYFQYRAAGAITNAMWLDNTGVLTVNNLLQAPNGITVGANNSMHQGINFTFNSNFTTHNSGNFNFGWVTSNALRIVGGDGGVLAVTAGDVLCWKQNQVIVKGQILAQEKFFSIDHPTKADHDLIHACLEGPESAVYYRGEGQLEHGRATIQLPNYFEALTRKEGRTVVLTPKGREPFLLSYEDIIDGTFRVYGTRTDGAFSWEVKAVRADVKRLEVEIKK